MRVVVTGASGNVGTSLLRALAEEDSVEEVLGLARRRPSREFAKTEWRSDGLRVLGGRVFARTERQASR
jgi:uncharacterized protein YbjT (DUF2867 family)